MILIICALHCEAKEIISKLSLKKTDEKCRFQFFRSEKILLAVCGTGSMNAAICSTYAITKYGITAILNIGICGASEDYAIGEIILCNKIISSGRTFYPDILYDHNFKETEIFCSSTIQHKTVCDMESAGVMEVASVFLSPDRVGILKIVSDYGNTKSIDSKFVSELIKQKADTICGWVTQFNTQKSSTVDMEIIEAVCENLNFTQAMKNNIYKKFVYHCIKNNDASFLNDYLSIHINTKDERKILYYEIADKLS